MGCRTSIAVLGATGSIGTSCLEVIQTHRETMRVAGLSANRSRDLLEQQVAMYCPDWAVLCESPVPDSAAATRWYQGAQHLTQLVRSADVDTVVCAVVGAAGLPSAWAAVDAGKRVAIANKECLVVAGPLMKQRAAETGALLLPVDSEHSAVFQCLQAGRPSEVRRVVLTASGGPFRGWTREQLRDVTPAMALRHPTWTMGPKISVDSATMMNKALEIIEARWLFGLSAEQIGVVVHPQSIIHSLVEFRDGAVISQMSPPDMKLPIQYALTFPQRLAGPASAFCWDQPQALELFPPDLDAFPALRLGLEVAACGGTAGAVLNAANEVAVERFLHGSLRFDQITQVSHDILNNHQFDAQPSLEQLMTLDAWAREEATSWRT